MSVINWANKKNFNRLILQRREGAVSEELDADRRSVDYTNG